MGSMYMDILEDIAKSDAIIEDTDKIYRTDDAAIFSGYSNTSNIFNVVSKDPNAWLLPSESYFRIKFSMTNAAESARQAAADSFATLINGGMHLFSQTRLIIDDNVVEQKLKPGFCHLIDHLLSTSRDQLKSVGENEWLYLDDGGFTAGAYTGSTVVPEDAFILSTETTGVDAQINNFWGLADPIKYLGNTVAGANLGGKNPKFNSGFLARWSRSRPAVDDAANPVDHDIELSIPATRVFGFFADIKSAFRGIKFECEFTKETNYAAIVHGRGASSVGGVAQNAAAIAHTLVKSIDWVVPSVIPSTLVLEKVQRQLTSGDRARKVFQSTTCYDVTRTPSLGALPGDYDVDWRIQSTGKKLVRVVVAFQRTEQYSNQNDADYAAVNNSNHANGGVFSTFNNINNIELRFGQTILPHERYERLQFGDTVDGPNFSRNLVDFYRAGGKWINDDDGCLVNYESFRYIYPCFVFDLSSMDLATANTVSEDLRVVATVNVANNNQFRILAMVTHEYPIDVYGVDGRVAFELPQ